MRVSNARFQCEKQEIRHKEYYLKIRKTGNIMTKFLSDLAAGLEPYTPGEQPKDKKYIKLNTNENPYPPSEHVMFAIEDEMTNLRLYPDPDASIARNAAADYYNKALNLQGKTVLTEENIFIGNGSDEVLALIFPTFFKGKRIAYADITYSFYPVYCALYEVDYKLLSLKDDFSIDVEEYCTGIDEDIKGILLCNPNAPTSRALTHDEVEHIIASNPDRLVVVDEAYVDFGAETVIDLINKYDNLLVCQTLSKSRQLAGMRIGLAVASKPLIDGLNAVKNSFNSYTADRLGIASCKAAFEDTEYFEETRKKIISTRERTVKELSALGFDIIPPSANFIFAKPPVHIKASDLFKQLRDKGVLVRYFAKPRIDDRLRISIGTEEEMDGLIAAVKELI